jgi:hypothetical protein
MYSPKKSSKKVAKKKFETCSRCPTPRACDAAGKCMAEAFG